MSFVWVYVGNDLVNGWGRIYSMYDIFGVFCFEDWIKVWGWFLRIRIRIFLCEKNV